eukprot:TRINITY_DN6294_c0_g1_i5.p1 TRINITY_DN6294_c0_g1~~TRINITY_DN6294_c0_g1_i5.p1  ORF type:complete len:554 (-),score=79.72 TRINITY_DN6294_c0_g1_i5:682-2343(-)
MANPSRSEDHGMSASLLPRSLSTSAAPTKHGSSNEYVSKSNTWSKGTAQTTTGNSSHVRFAADPTQIKSEIPEDPSLRDDAGSTPLHWATIHGQVDKVIQLLRKGANVHVKNNAGYTPLHCAAEFGNVRLVTILVEHGADPKAVTGSGHTALHCAARWGHNNVMQLLIEDYKADVNAQDQNGWSPLHFAAFHGFDALARLLCEHGASIKATTKRGETPLHGASVNGHEKCVDLLLSAGSDVNSTDSWGGTPLHYSCYNGHDKTVRLLISQGADPTIRDSSGRTPLDVSSKNCAEILREAERGAAQLISRPRSASEDTAILAQIHFEATTRKTKISQDATFQSLSEIIHSMFCIRGSVRISYLDEEHHTSATTKHEPGVTSFVGRLPASSPLVLLTNDEDIKIAFADLRKRKNRKIRIFVESERNLIPFVCLVLEKTPPLNLLLQTPVGAIECLEHRLMRISPSLSFREVSELLRNRLQRPIRSIYFRIQEYLITVDTDQDWKEVLAELASESIRQRPQSPFADNHSTLDVASQIGCMSLSSGEFITSLVWRGT